MVAIRINIRHIIALGLLISYSPVTTLSTLALLVTVLMIVKMIQKTDQTFLLESHQNQKSVKESAEKISDVKTEEGSQKDCNVVEGNLESEDSED